MNRNQLLRIFSDFLHGWTLKSFALAARMVFLLLLVPRLPGGELAIYVYISSMALVIVTIATLGLEEELPRSVAGDLSIAEKYFLWYYILVALSILSLLIFFLYPTVYFGIILLSVTLISMRFWGGLIRSIDVSINERQQNLPWVLFLLVALMMRLNNAFDLVLTMALAIMVVQVLGFCQICLRRMPSWYTTAVSLRIIMQKCIRKGSVKLFSNLMLMGASRAAVLIPVWLGMGINIDGLAFAIAAGEAVSQFGMIPANRAYAKWCREKPVSRRVWRDTLTGGFVLWVFLSGIAVLGVSIIQYLNFMPRQVQSTYLLLTAMIFFALIPSFRLLRYLLWARGLGDILITSASFLLCLACGLVVYFLPVNLWFVSSAGVLIFVVFVIATLSRPAFSREVAIN